jgi:hypothetical protein
MFPLPEEERKIKRLSQTGPQENGRQRVSFPLCLVLTLGPQGRAGREVDVKRDPVLRRELDPGLSSHCLWLGDGPFVTVLNTHVGKENLEGMR